MELHIRHETCYDYTPLVEMAQHVAYLRPIDTPWQTVRACQLAISPEPAACEESVDVYGNHRTFFSLATPHTQLTVRAQAVVTTRAPDPAPSTLGWEALRDHFRYRAGMTWSDAVEFSFPSPRAPRDEAFITFAQPCFEPGRTALEAVRALMHRIHEEFTYESQSTEVHTTALEALDLRKGVCQDFAHIMLACLRSMGLPARYVSGYLLTRPPPGKPRLIGSDASHAWVSVFLPDLPGAEAGRGWYDLDPTNDRDGWGTPGEDYVTLATGRDYADVSPMRGVIHGGGQHTLSVAVSVVPADEAYLLDADTETPASVAPAAQPARAAAPAAPSSPASPAAS